MWYFAVFIILIIVHQCCTAKIPVINNFIFEYSSGGNRSQSKWITDIAGDFQRLRVIAWLVFSLQVGCNFAILRRGKPEHGSALLCHSIMKFAFIIFEPWSNEWNIKFIHWRPSKMRPAEPVFSVVHRIAGNRVFNKTVLLIVLPRYAKKEFVFLYGAAEV